MSPKRKRRAKVITTDGPVSLPRPSAGGSTPPADDSPAVPRDKARRAEIDEYIELGAAVSETNDDAAGAATDDHADEGHDRDDHADDDHAGEGHGDEDHADRSAADNADAATIHEAAEPKATTPDESVSTTKSSQPDPSSEQPTKRQGDGDEHALRDDRTVVELPPAEQIHGEPLPQEVSRLQSELVQGAVRREQHIAEITAAVAQAIAKAHREVNQSASELDSLRSMLQGVASADESQSFLEIERVQSTIQATQAEWTELTQRQQDLEAEVVRMQQRVDEREAALDANEASRVRLETDRNDAERRTQELFDRLSEATSANAELKGRLDDLVAAEDVSAKLERKIRDLTAEKATTVHRAKTDEAALQKRLDQALDKLAASQQARTADKAAATDSALADALDKAKADSIKMQAELDMVRAELAKTKRELDQAYVAETELETKLQSAWTAADDAEAEQQTVASDQQRLLRDLSDANENLEKMRSRLDKAAGEKKSALAAAGAQHEAEAKAAETKHQAELKAAETKHQTALEAAESETQSTLDKQTRDHQAGVAALKAAHKKKLDRQGEELQEQSAKVADALRREKAELEKKLAASDRLKKDHEAELASRDAATERLRDTHARALQEREDEADRLRESHAREIDSRAADSERLERSHKSELDAQRAATEASEARLKKLQTAHDELLDEHKKFEAERKTMAARGKELEDLQSQLEAADARAVEREAELEKLRLSSDDTHQRIGTLLGQIETLQASADAQVTHVAEMAARESELETEVVQLRKQATSAIEARSKVIKGAESTALLASQAETRAEQLDRELQQASVERDAVTGALTTAEARIVNLEAELDRITTLADQRVQAAFESATALGERAIADAEAKERRIQELEAQLSLLQRRGSGVS